jgi:hypothetical protein
MAVMAPKESWTDDQIDARFSDLTRLMQMGLIIIGAILTLITGMLAGLITLIVAQL